jgi:hypothetical protein
MRINRDPHKRTVVCVAVVLAALAGSGTTSAARRTGSVS